jgi:pimeloyl-ACP methyl ester carboxylesterase
MIEEAQGRIDYDEAGAGPTIVFVPGSCSTGAAWRPVIAACGGQFRCVTTSLLGYGGTTERRTASSKNAPHAETMPLHICGTGPLTVFADPDQTGLSAARACAERWNAAGKEAEVSSFRSCSRHLHES